MRHGATTRATGGVAILTKLTAAHRAELRRIAPLLKPLVAQLQK
jgi:hypothetical protein